ncbi:phosphotransferase family protein [Streptomyces sp. NRRL F-5123]|uniref:phosphotransferase family protein n=1 Tax=Streptomyces sp. NRRL F-5123 TaxID=1463856 RepID=UPI0004E20BAE|nr:aminoglycoside phosphotransferase family protein [Streptomyces sp. NRRL F-5123]
MRAFAEDGETAGIVRDALGARVQVLGVERLRGGSHKGVYRVRTAGGPADSVVVYRWAAGENYWPGEEPAGAEAFLAAGRRLGEAGARVPRVLHADTSRERYAADVAVVEDLTGGSLEDALAADPAGAAGALAELGGMLAAMHAVRSPAYGTVLAPEEGAPPRERRVLDSALRDTDEAARRDPRIAAARTALRDLLEELAAAVPPRTGYGLIHGELGPDHVLLDAAGHPVLIDIEGAKFSDVEAEHVFLRLRFGPHYAALAAPGLDPRRMALYELAMRLQLVAGPLRLLDGDFPDRAAMRSIAEHNLQAALALLAAATDRSRPSRR